MSEDALFQREIVASYVQQPRFIRRDWLAARVEEQFGETGCRFLLLTAEPGAGKSAFVAQLAEDHTGWPVTFIRRDQRAPLLDASAHTFLLRLGYQLAALYPQLFEPDQVRVVVRQRIGSVDANAEVVAAEVERILASPFYKRVIEVRQQVSSSQANVTGLRVGEWVVDPRLLPVEDLQYMALLDPAAALLERDEDARIVILVDALDELRYHQAGDDLLTWLSQCPPLPANVRFLLTSRPPDARLRFFMEKQREAVRTISLSSGESRLEDDVRRYARRLIEDERIAPFLETKQQSVESLVEQAVARADGNIGYLDAVARALEQAVRRGDAASAKTALKFDALPATLAQLYAFFLGQIQAQVGQEGFQVADEEGNPLLLRAWDALYLPILSLLAVAREPLTLEQVAAYTRSSAQWTHLSSAIDRLGQFLDGDDSGYRFYHASLPEFLTDDQRKTQEVGRPFYVSAAGAHRRLADHFWRSFRDQWSRCDGYGLRHLAWHLKAAGEGPRLFELFSPAWLEAQFTASGDYRLFFEDIGLALEAAQEATPPDLYQIARLCLIQGQLTSVAPPPVVYAVARAGQIARAASLAANITFALDRCQAHALLAQAAARHEATDLARQALQEAQRDLEAIDETNRPMALAWVTEAALLVDEPQLAGTLAQRALQIALRFEPAHTWDHPNALFWAAKSLRLVADDAGLVQIQRVIREKEMNPLRNLVLQAMSVAGDTEGLQAIARERLADPHSSIRLANLALALADAGLVELCREVLAASDAGMPDHGGVDTPKRKAWALALLGEFDRAIEVAAGIADAEERAKAFGRVAAVATAREQTHRLAHIATAAESLSDSDDWRILSRLAPLYVEVGLAGKALQLAEAVCRQNVQLGATNSLATPRRRAAAVPMTAPLVFVQPRKRGPFDWLRRGKKARQLPGAVKTDKRAIQLDIKPVADARTVDDALQLARQGEWAQATEAVATLKIPAFKARALLGLAVLASSSSEALQLWLQAIQAARWAGAGLLDDALDAGRPYLQGAEQPELWTRLQQLRESIPGWWHSDGSS